MQDLRLTWNYQNGNLTQRRDEADATSRIENFTYDGLDRLITATVVGKATQTVNYGNIGNIDSKTDAGTYTYLPGRPNAVTTVSNPLGVVPSVAQAIAYTPFAQPATVNENNYQTTYTYGADYERIRNVTTLNGSETGRRYYFGDYERITEGGSSAYVHYVSSPAGLIALVASVGTADGIYYAYTDHLGSILRLVRTDQSIVTSAEQSFDAWGRRRNPTSWDPLAPTAPTGLPYWLIRGYTSHEHLDQFGLINMNGRLYDPALGRVLSADNYVQDPFSTQSYNRYSYVLNNPLSYNDPDGHFWNFVIGGVLGGIAGRQAGKSQGLKGINLAGSIFAGAVIGTITAGIGAGVAASTASWGTVGSGLATGAVSGFVGGGFNASLAGGNFLQGAARGALWGGAIGGGMGILSAAMGANKTIGTYEGNGEPLTNDPVEFSKDSFMKFLSDNNLDPDAVNTRMYISSEGNPNGFFFDKMTKFYGEIGKNSTGNSNIAWTVKAGKFFQNLFSNKTNTYIAEGAFSSSKLLYITTGHEFIHAYHYSFGANIVIAPEHALTERSAYGWSIMAAKSIGYTGLTKSREMYNIYYNSTININLGRFHWKFVPGIIKR